MIQIHPMGKKAEFVGEWRISRTAGLRWQLEAPLVYHSLVSDPPTTFTVPSGFKTGFGSFPAIVRWLVMPKDTRHRRATRAAILYSWLLRDGGETTEAARAVFREALAAGGVRFWLRWLFRITV